MQKKTTLSIVRLEIVRLSINRSNNQSGLLYWTISYQFSLFNFTNKYKREKITHWHL